MVATGVQVLGAKVIYSHPPSGYGRGRRWHAAVPDFSRGRRPRAAIFGRAITDMENGRFFFVTPDFRRWGVSGPVRIQEQNRTDFRRVTVCAAQSVSQGRTIPRKSFLLSQPRNHSLAQHFVVVWLLFKIFILSRHAVHMHARCQKGAAAPDVFEPA